jgi:SecD/SecF fusion protein
VAADANVVIYERIKEEARTGVSIPRAIAGGYTKALKTIIDANVITIGVAFILFMLATAGVKGFAFTLGVGTIVSLFTAVLATSAILGSLARTRFMGSRAMLGVGEEEHVGWRFDFMGASKWFFSMSGLILAIGALAIAGLGINFGIDFESGSRIQTPLEQEASVDEVRDTLEPLGLGEARIQEVEDPELGENVVSIRSETLAAGEDAQVREALDNAFGVRGADFTVETIGPTFGEQIARTAVIAIIASLALIALYIGLRFEFKFAVPVLIALAHDLLITSGIYALSEREVTTSTVAALLTILGYSLYDTIIVFDRIRENVPRMPRATFTQIVNRSMSEVLTRSLVTSFSTLVPVAALMLFGGETLKDFGFALLVGVASSTYSSIFIAAPVLTEWKEREPMYRRRRQVVMDDHGGVVPAYAETALGEEPAPPAREPSRVGQAAARAARRARRRAPAAADEQAQREATEVPGAAEAQAVAMASEESAALGSEDDKAAEAAERAEGRPAPERDALGSSTAGGRSKVTPGDGADGEGREREPAAAGRPRKQKQGGSSRKARKKHGRR